MDDKNDNQLILGRKPSTPDYTQLIARLRRTFFTGKTRNVDFRIEQLKNLARLYDENEDVLARALHEDLRKSRFEAMASEILFLKVDVHNMIDSLRSWTTPQTPPKTIANLLDDVEIHPQPYGVVLIMAAWNYPVQITFMPMSGAIAAGNCIVIKPSEIASATSRVIAELIPKYLDRECYTVVEGGVLETTELLKNHFDYIFYTGSTSVGRVVHAAAAKHLTPVTLELGGKSPVYVADDADLNITAARILWGKCLNLGQTCVAPDYVLCSKNVEEQLVKKLSDLLREWYGDDRSKSPDLCRIITDRHFERLIGLLSTGKIVIGGGYVRAERFIEPTVLVDVQPSDPIMREEIFGPILPILRANTPEEAAAFINAHDRPLALYVFTCSAKTKEFFVTNTSAGGMCVNDTIMHLVCDSLPFGGVGASGMGAYHGKFSFDTFTHMKGVLGKGFNGMVEAMQAIRYPPYNAKKLGVLTRVMAARWTIPVRGMVRGALLVCTFVAGVGSVFVWDAYMHKLKQ